MADLETIRTGWDQAAREDAMFNIVTLPQYINGGWPKDEFFAHGKLEIDAMIAHLDELGLRGERRDYALDFGCGVGRLTQALAPEYGRVFGADVSAEMIKQAKELNGLHNVTYRHTGESLLDSFHVGEFDLIYSRITLQHMPPHLQRGYIDEFIQLLAPEGLAVFQTPDGPDYQHPSDWLSMYGVPHDTVVRWVEEAGARLLDVELLEDASPTWLAYRYTVTP